MLLLLVVLWMGAERSEDWCHRSPYRSQAASEGVPCKELQSSILQSSPSCPTSLRAGGTRREAMPLCGRKAEDLAGMDLQDLLAPHLGDLRSRPSAVLEDALPVTERLAVFRTRRSGQAGRLAPRPAG